jgi:selenide,water dikinase
MDLAHRLFDNATHQRGGCNCKLGPAELRQILEGLIIHANDDLVAGVREQDDAGVIRLADGKVLATSVDFQNPIHEDFYTSGYIAAANALSDLYAMGLSPQFANVILAVTESDDAVRSGREFLAGISEAAREAGCAISGGHTFLGLEPLCGLAVYGIGDESSIKRKSDAVAGDVIILTKPIGSGIVTAAKALGLVPGNQHVEVMRRLNRAGAWLGRSAEVHAMTDVSGFGLLGHACELASASAVTLEIDAARVPTIRGAVGYAQEGIGPRLGQKTLDAWKADVRFRGRVSPAKRSVLADPQTNGGLLLTVSSPASAGILKELRAGGDGEASVIGRVVSRGATGELLIFNGTEP